ncbi:MAG: LysR family transcriptional regulator [Clostridia bacterium]|nr:LysR family transcriptional regulator [Clostridia bacterium]
MPNMELYRIFIIVADEENITRASEILNISQPAVTKHIKNLENELNTILFNRSHGMQLTKQGKILYEKVASHVKAIDEAEKLFEKNRAINFGTYATMLSKVLNTSIAQFYNENKDAKINAYTDQFNTFFEKFLNYELDAVLIIKKDESEFDTSKIKYIKLGMFDYAIIANNNSTLCGKKVKAKDFKNKIVYVPRGRNIAVCKFIDIMKENNIEVNSIDSVTMEGIVEKNENSIGLANKDYFVDEINQGRVTALDVDFKLPKGEFGIYYHKDNQFPELLKLIRIIKKQFN